MYEGALNSELIVDAALAIVRESGLAALTMRRLATDLRTAPMTVYRHVDDRRALLLLMLDVVADGVKLDPVSGDPRTDVTAAITAIHDALQADSWAVELLVTDKLASPKILPSIERIFAGFTAAGLAPEDVAAAYSLVWHYTVGEIMDRHHAPADAYSRAMVDAADPASYPSLTSVVSQLRGRPPLAPYSANLSRLLDGLLGEPSPHDACRE
ncbi:MAG: TetR/AcrR family transcriptional regulator C-terminal domain-containing protein [Rhodococcus sp. (in: high G+C Gram-positive bacteria)]|nr:TetR/AcrR family transcriptional regulator C-terminal domain-containing protein [Rhodococcus sp. (in: high G+C Gram-positive bacteria)]